MITYNIITAICFALLTLAALYVIISLIVKKRADRITFIRGFKRGKCAAIFLIAIPLLSLGYIYDGSNVFEGILNGMGHVVDLVLLKFGISKVSNLLDASLFYKITAYYCCVLVVLNAMLFALSFIGKQIWLLGNMLVRKFTRKDKLFIFGNNDNSVSIYKSNKTFCAAIVDDVQDEESLELYKRKIKYISRDDYSELINAFFKNVLKNKKENESKENESKENKSKENKSKENKSKENKSKENKSKEKNYKIVINTENDESNLSICNIFIDKIHSLKEDDQQSVFNHLRVYVFGDPRYEALYGDIVSRSFGTIHYKNKYQMLAMDFIDRYPFTKFMDERHIDYSTSLIKPTTDINVCMIGFGKPNRQIFLTSVANNQFLTATENGVDLKQVTYHIFDKDEAENNKNLNHLYYRFKNECKNGCENQCKAECKNECNINPENYLPLPALPAKDKIHHLDINAPKFYKEIHDIITKRPTDVNFAIVSFESDLENIDMAQKLVEKRREWGAEDLVIFVRTQKSHKEDFIFREKNVFFIGIENECVYDIYKIISDKFFEMAQKRNEIYDLEYAIKKDKDFVVDDSAVKKNRINANRSWFLEKSQLERESSLYCCLSLQSKLNLMGLEYCKVGDNALPAMTEEEYINYYAKGDLPDTQTYNLTAEGKRIINYTLNFPKSRRYNLAVLEHLRWNSFMLSKGVVPATKEQIENEMIEKDGKLKHSNGKNYRLRRHGNLTTFDGLVEFRQMLAKRDGGDEAEYDVIKYDYQILDDAYWLLNKNDYKIVKRDNSLVK